MKIEPLFASPLSDFSTSAVSVEEESQDGKQLVVSCILCLANKANFTGSQTLFRTDQIPVPGTRNYIRRSHHLPNSIGMNPKMLANLKSWEITKTVKNT